VCNTRGLRQQSRCIINYIKLDFFTLTTAWTAAVNA